MNNFKLQNRSLQFDVQQDGQCVMGRMTVKSTGFQTPWVPLLVLEIYDRMQERTDAVSQFAPVFFEPEGDASLHIVLRDAQRGVTVGLWLRLDDAGLSLVFPPSEIEETGESLYRVFSASLFPA